MHRLIAVAAVAAALPALALAPPPPSEPTYPPAPGVVRGTVKLIGPPPPRGYQPGSRDPFCPSAPPGEARVIADGGGRLKNVVVRIIGAPAGDAPAQPLLLTIDHCAYQPRVAAMVAGQRFLIRNGDPTTHRPRARRGRYQTVLSALMTPSAADVDRRFNDANTLLQFDCDAHPFEQAWVWVAPNSLFAVTDEKGNFSIAHVPSGNWEIEAWHEQFGTKKARVIVLPDRPAEIQFDFRATDSSRFPY